MQIRYHLMFSVGVGLSIYLVIIVVHQLIVLYNKGTNRFPLYKDKLGCTTNYQVDDGNDGRQDVESSQDPVKSSIEKRKRKKERTKALHSVYWDNVIQLLDELFKKETYDSIITERQKEDFLKENTFLKKNELSVFQCRETLCKVVILYENDEVMEQFNEIVRSSETIGMYQIGFDNTLQSEEPTTTIYFPKQRETHDAFDKMKDVMWERVKSGQIRN